MDESAILSARKRRGLVYRVHWLFGLKKHENSPKDARQTKQLPEIGTFLWESQVNGTSRAGVKIDSCPSCVGYANLPLGPYFFWYSLT